MSPGGEVLVRAPYGLSQAQILRLVASKRAWIERQLARMEQRRRVWERTRPLTQQELSELAERAHADLAARCERFAPLVGVGYGRVTVRRQRTRWGSCSTGGNLNFNCLLMLAPEPVRDYVVVHELCHRRYMDHSPRFWAEVERVLPGWREQRRWLRENGDSLQACLGPRNGEERTRQ